MAYRNYSTAVSHIVDATGQGDFTTIQAAINAAVSGQTIFVRPGTYIENLTLKNGVNICSFIGDADTPNVIISGKATLTTAGEAVTFSGIFLQTNGDFAIVISGSQNSAIILDNCTLSCANNTGISLTSSGAEAQVVLHDSTIFIGTTGVAVWSMSSPGLMSLQNCVAGIMAGVTAVAISSNSAGAVTIKDCNLPFSVGTTGTGGIFIDNCYMDTTGFNQTPLTVNGTGANVAYFSFFGAGSASAVTVGTGASLNMAHDIVGSSNTNAITGLGTLNAGLITFVNSSSTINTSTVNKLTTYGGTIV